MKITLVIETEFPGEIVTALHRHVARLRVFKMAWASADLQGIGNPEAAALDLEDVIEQIGQIE